MKKYVQVLCVVAVEHERAHVAVALAVLGGLAERAVVTLIRALGEHAERIQRQGVESWRCVVGQLAVEARVSQRIAVSEKVLVERAIGLLIRVRRARARDWFAE